MEQKEQYTAGEPQNLNKSDQAGVNDTNETKADAAAIMVSALAMMRRAGWKVETRQDNLNKSAYIVFPKTFWNHRNGSLELVQEETE